MNKLTFVSGVLALSFLSVTSMANAEKLSPYEVFRLEVVVGTAQCRYRPVIDGVEMQWFEGDARINDVVNIRTMKCYTKNHGKLGELHGFNNKYIGSGITSYGPWTVAEYEKAMSARQ